MKYFIKMIKRILSVIELQSHSWKFIKLNVILLQNERNIKYLNKNFELRVKNDL